MPRWGNEQRGQHNSARHVAVPCTEEGGLRRCGGARRPRPLPKRRHLGPAGSIAPHEAIAGVPSRPSARALFPLFNVHLRCGRRGYQVRAAHVSLSRVVPGRWLAGVGEGGVQCSVIPLKKQSPVAPAPAEHGVKLAGKKSCRFMSERAHSPLPGPPEQWDGELRMTRYCPQNSPHGGLLVPSHRHRSRN